MRTPVEERAEEGRPEAEVASFPDSSPFPHLITLDAESAFSVACESSATACRNPSGPARPPFLRYLSGAGSLNRGDFVAQ